MQDTPNVSGFHKSKINPYFSLKPAVQLYVSWTPGSRLSAGLPHMILWLPRLCFCCVTSRGHWGERKSEVPKALTQNPQPALYIPMLLVNRSHRARPEACALHGGVAGGRELTAIVLAKGFGIEMFKHLVKLVD